MSELRGMLEETVGRLFGERVTKELIEAAERGDWPHGLWDAIEANGLTRPHLPEDAGGAGGTWREAFVILRAGRPIGFAVVTRPPSRGGGTDADYRLSEFFVVADQRKLGVGREAALLLFSRFNGRWEVTEQSRNAGAVQFWRRVIRLYTKGRYTERAGNGEVTHRFTSERAPT